MNAQELKSKLTDEDIKIIIQNLGSELIDETEDYILFTTYACHEGHSNKLYYYKDTENNKLRYKTVNIFHCYSECGQMDILNIVCKNKSYIIPDELPKAINYICTLLGFSTIKEGFSNDSMQIINDWSFINNYKRQANKTINKKKLPIYDKKILNIFQDIYTSEWINEGISKEVMKNFNIKYCTLQQKIIIPHYDINNNLIGIRGRAMLEEDEKEFGKYTPFRIHNVMYNHPLGLNLYGINMNSECIKRKKKVMLVESEKSVHQCSTIFGMNNNFTLALCGNKLTDEQKLIILNLGVEEVIIGLDRQFKTVGDDEYYKWIDHIKKKLINELVAYVRVYILWDITNLLPYKASPTDCGKDVLLQLMKNKIYVST